MIYELGGGAPQRSLAEQDQFGQALAFNGAHPSLGKSIGEGGQLHRMVTLPIRRSKSSILIIH